MCKTNPSLSIPVKHASLPDRYDSDGTRAEGARVMIRVNGKAVFARNGMSVHAALTAAGITRLNLSASGEPSGALCGMGICYQCLVTIDGVPDRRACMTPVRENMEIITQTGTDASKENGNV